MKRMPVSDMSQEQLVEQVIAVAVEQAKAEFWDDTPAYNRLFKKMEKIEQELKSRAGDGRHALIALLDDENSYIRLKAAFATLALSPEAARAVLEQLSIRNRPPGATQARSMLRSLEIGRYVPE